MIHVCPGDFSLWNGKTWQINHNFFDVDESRLAVNISNCNNGRRETSSGRAVIWSPWLVTDHEANLCLSCEVLCM